jgi:hypothetical protein
MVYRAVIKTSHGPSVFRGKTLKSQLLKKLSIEFFETQDLSSTNRKPKLFFYNYSWHFFFLQPIAEGNCEYVEPDAQNLRMAKMSILGPFLAVFSPTT